MRVAMPVHSLSPTAYHREIRETLSAHEPGLWAWYASDKFDREQTERARLELLKTTYRLDASTHAEVYRLAREVAARLRIEASITIYQGGAGEVMNAGLCFVPGEVHLVLTGPILSRLDEQELRALLGHELAHYRLWTEDEGAYRVAEALVEAVAHHASASTSWIQLANRQRRYTEVYADRGCLVATDGDLHAAVRCLLKVSAGVEAPDGEAYLRQVDEVVENTTDASRTESHPELFLRAWAMKKWLADGPDADASLRERIAGPRTIETLDLLEQHELMAETRLLIARFLSLPGLRCEATLAHARQFFPELDPTDHDSKSDFHVSESMADYFGYVLLDLATADSDLADVALAAALHCADEIGFGTPFEKLARKELRLTIANIAELRAHWPSMKEELAKKDAKQS
jgi:hypothetical protein